MIDGSTQLKRSGWSWWYLLFAIQFVHCSLAAVLQHCRTLLDRHPFLLLVSTSVRGKIGAALTAVVYVATGGPAAAE